MGRTTAFETRWRSENPGALIVAGSEISGDVGQGDVGNASVEDFDERGERDHDGDKPGVVLGAPGFGRRSRSLGGGVESLGAVCHTLGILDEDGLAKASFYVFLKRIHRLGLDRIT